ncbi:MAG: membrane protein insertion efficiency factor YidD [Desulfurobacteriaceae bacterium]
MLKKVFILFIRFYQKYISPLFPSSCRYYPTCSNYAIMAIEKYGILKGSIKAIFRILRCNPFSKGGIDYP